MAHCSMCNRPIMSPDELATSACAGCASVIGVVPMPPSRRPAAPCTRCSGRQFVRAIPREHSSAREHVGQTSAPMHVTYKPRVKHAATGTFAMPVEIELAGLGLLEMYICKKCGFVEWYCHDIEKVPAHPALMTEHIDYDSDNPYR